MTMTKLKSQRSSTLRAAVCVEEVTCACVEAIVEALIWVAEAISEVAWEVETSEAEWVVA